MSEAAPDAPSARVLPRALRLLRAHRKRVALLLVTILIAAGLGVGAPLLTKAVFDNALFPEGGEPNVGLLIVLVVAIIGLVALAGGAGILQAYLASVVGQLVMHDLRDSMYRHLQRMPLGFFTGTRTGEIQSRIAHDIGGVGAVVSKAAVSVVANVVFLLLSLAAMAYLAWPLALLSVAILPVFTYVSFRVGRSRRHVSESRQRALAEMTSITQETLSVSGALLSKVFGGERRAVERYRVESKRLADLSVRQEMVGRVFLGIAQTFFLLAPALVYLGAGILMARGSIEFTAGTLVAFTALQIRLFTPVRDLLQTSLQVQTSAPLFERIFQYLDLDHEIVDAPGARALDHSRVRGAIAFDDVSFRYPPQRAAAGPAGAPRPWTLEQVSLEIEPGQLAALVGPSGAGKTTLTYLLARLYDVDRGAITIDGTDLRQITLASLAETIGIVTQETYLLHTSVRENLAYARPEATEEELERAARLALIHDRILELEDGYDTVVGERGYRMSGGEKQRLAIARVILKDPRVLILDEATSSLDTASERLVQQALDPVMRGRATIAIAHRLSTVLSADIIFVLDGGRVVERGTHAELLAQGGLYASLCAHQFEGALHATR